MGIPGFYRWLLNNYPKAVSPAIADDINQDTFPDHCAQNPNGFEFDNLYLDMNGIIHPDDSTCFGQDIQPTTFQGVFFSVFQYVDRLFNIVRPQKLIYFAIGTEFMWEFSKALQVYIQTRLQESHAWKNLKVIVSDGNVPGEAEHKIMCFIRTQRSLPHYDVNTRHCLHGLDADLVILALVTHELHISILREDVITVKKQPAISCVNGLDVNIIRSCKFSPVKKTRSYQFFNVWILREYLELEMRPSDVPEGFKFDNERMVDDFVLMSFFVGNDFLPHLPSLLTNEGGLDLLMTVYKRHFKSLGGYIVDAQQVNDPRNASYLNLERVERLILAVGSYEEAIFKKRTDLRELFMRRILKEEANKADGDAVGVTTIDHHLSTSLHSDNCGAENDNILENTQQLKEDVRKYIYDKSNVIKIGIFGPDKIKYGISGWKERYYLDKFPTNDPDNLESLKRAAVKEYVVGLCWNILYYYSGVPSWTWFYPYHYGPCASDLKGLSQVEVKFEEGFPFDPFDQLLAVLPPRSADILPLPNRRLMMEESSDIASFFPREVDVDLDGKRFLWQGQVLLPFIDEKCLLAATKKAKERADARRNLPKSDLLYVRTSSDIGYQLLREMVENRRHQSRDPNEVCGFVNLNLHAFDSPEGEDNILCVNFALAKPSILVSRVLEHVKFPERTVYESDIGHTVLWHEQQVSFQGHRVPYQTQHQGPPKEESIGPSSRQGLYTHPNWYRTRHESSYSPRGRSSIYSLSRASSEVSGTWSNSKPAWSPQFTSSQGSRGGRFWTHKDRQNPGAPEQGRFNRW